MPIEEGANRGKVGRAGRRGGLGLAHARPKAKPAQKPASAAASRMIARVHAMLNGMARAKLRVWKAGPP